MIEHLVSDLPEVYQPIHGHPELSGQVSRSCADRLAHIARIHDGLQSLLARPLKVLDLGCAQGYFSFNLAERGASVHGVDFLDKNVAVCNALAQENAELQVSFEVGRVEDAIAALEPEQYDLVLGLSVFHHIVHEKGVVAVRAMFDHAAAQSGALVVELALREEPLYWAPAQAEDPRSLLDGIAFVHEAARHDTHLAPIPRPLFVASNRYWILDGRADRFEDWSFEPHALAHGTHCSSRRYFFSAEAVLKHYRFDHPRGEHNKAEFTKELQFLQQPPRGFLAPELIQHGKNDKEGWLVIQRIHGRLLLDLLREGGPVECRVVLLEVLKQLAVLEGAGLYHDDVRTWNVIVAEDGTSHLIDYGSIGSRAQDCVWPGNLFLSFLIFVREVVTGVVDDPDPLRTIAISPYGLPQPYRAWASHLWRRPLAQWSFKIMYETLIELPVEVGEESLARPEEAWMTAMEEAAQVQKLFSSNLRHELGASRNQFDQMFSALTASHNRELTLCHSAFERLEDQVKAAEGKALAAESRAQEAESRAQDAESRIAVMDSQLAQLDGDLEATRKELHAVHQANHHHWQQWETTKQELDAVHHANHNHWQLAEARHHTLSAVHRSLSWRITAPLRFVAGLLIHPGATLRNSANHAVHCTVETSQRPLSRIMAAVLRRPKLAYRINQFLMRYPGLYQQLLGVARRHGVVPGSPHYVAPAAPSPQQVEAGLENLSPHARRIYGDLKTAIEKNKRPN